MEQYSTLYTQILESSEFLKSLEFIKNEKSKSRLFGAKVRPLTMQEIKKLKAQGNRSDDWKMILVSKKFKADFISCNYFKGKCILGHFDGRDTKIESSASFSSGIYNSTIINTEIGDNCCIKDANCISNYIIKEDCVIHNIGSLVCSDNSSFGNGREISVGIETGGREVLSFAEMTIETAQAVSTQRSNSVLQNEYKVFISKYTDSCRTGIGLVGNACVIRHTPKIEDSCIGESTLIDCAALIQNCTILGSSEEPTEISHGAYIKNSCIQWGCRITSMAIVEDSVLTEHSYAERHGKVTHSIIGPNTGIGEGEVTASLVGPFVGFHHQSLLIAAIWPEGKGNVGYGANIGSNHTSKAPDQEIWCGEGTFFGLGVNIKFPSDFTLAPYSIIATAVKTLPQRVEFPFSLISNPSFTPDGIPEAFNEIIPAWVLSDNIYVVKRNEGKFKKRNKAKRSCFDFSVFRPDIISLMSEALKRLKEISLQKEYYTSKDLAGLGKNFMTEAGRIKAIAAYERYIEYYCLSGLKLRIEKLIKGGAESISADILETASDDTLWEHQRKMLLNSESAGATVKDMLTRLIDMEQDISDAVQKAKEKDDVRGREIIRDYASAHAKASEDSFIKETRANFEKIKIEIHEFFKYIK